MEQNTRRKMIMELLSERDTIHIAELAAACGYSPMTIRRDLARLEENGYLVVRRGMVTLHGGTASEISSSIKAGRCQSQKKHIAKAAAQFAQPGSTLYLDCGTTVRELALELVNVKNLTVYTNSLLVCNALCNFPNIKLFVLPGQFFECSMGSTDTSTLLYLQRLRFDAAFLGAEAVHPESGFMVPDSNDCDCKRTVAAHSTSTVVLADSSKLYLRSRCIYASAQEIDTFITDDRCPPEALNAFSEKGVQVFAV